MRSYIDLVENASQNSPEPEPEPDLDTLNARIHATCGLETFFVGWYGDALKLHSITVARGEKGHGKGTRAMQMLCAFADEHGLRIVLTPARKGEIANGPTSQTRLIEFYQRFGFVLNTGRSRDFSITALMYREPRARAEGIVESTEAASGSHNPDGSNLLYHWVGVKLAARYLSSKRMSPKWKHLIPKRGITTGVCFAYDPESWWTHDIDRVCIVLDRSKLPNRILDVNGQATFDFASYAGLNRDIKADLERRTLAAKPDEAFVLGAIDIGPALVKVLTPGTEAVAAFAKRAAKAGVTVEVIDSPSTAGIQTRERTERWTDKLPRTLETLRQQVPPDQLDDRLYDEALARHKDRTPDEIRQRIADLDVDRKYAVLMSYLDG